MRLLSFKGPVDTPLTFCEQHLSELAPAIQSVKNTRICRLVAV